MIRLREKQLLDWLQHPKRKPLILRGARQVGKSTLVRNFSQKQKLTLAEVNLERHPRLDAVFQTKDTKKIIAELESLTQVRLRNPGTLLFLDEIQAAPNALPALRYFWEEEPSLPVIAAGSLLEFLLSEHDFSMPVGRVDYLHLGPMTFEEYLMAAGDDYLLDLLLNFKLGETIPETAHEKLLERQREFLFVGGMPESILAAIESKSFIEASRVQRSILQTYQDDFAKYATTPKERRLVQKILDSLPKLIGKKAKYSEISRDDRSGEVRHAVELLIQARLLLPAYHTNASELPLKADQDRDTYKLYFLDVGLFNHVSGLEWTHVSRLSDRELINEGTLAEQYVAQHLAYASGGLEPPELHYWLRESRSQNAEVDFLISRGREILPIEVKAGKSGTLKSLLQLMQSKNLKTAIRFDLNPPSRLEVEHKLSGPTHATHGRTEVAFTLHSFPLYMADFLERILGNLPINPLP